MTKLRTKHDNRTALLLVAPFVIVYAALFLYPTLQMLAMSLTNGQLILPGEFVGLDNYLKLFRDWRFGNSVRNTAYFVGLTVVPGTLLGLAFAMLVVRLKGLWQAVVLAAFFLPYILPVTTVTTIWSWFAYGPGQLVLPERVLATPAWVLPMAAVITVWWTVGFNVLLFMAGLKNIPAELYEAARLDGAGRWAQFRNITWPLIWPVTALVLTIQLITQIKVFDQVYLLVQGGRVDATMVLVQYIYTLAFQRNQGGYAATVAVALFVLVAVLSVLQFQLLRSRR
ncbi:sugar ABC transporter permease [Devosia sp. ZB163]|uniref:carbohydrate ABC transporter permease n=1 Tax=Devosia sp. ZB163 TaxID=3025938 RepID=UPI00236114EC|nr:sugar ABC transporter permease [Devosia sp. ZB163]MDC9825587.1 sugar ABC transporter permease [Devosia sp. ZB163]